MGYNNIGMAYFVVAVLIGKILIASRAVSIFDITLVFYGNVSGKHSDERYEFLSNAYEAEQTALRELVQRLEVEITEESKQSYDLEKFIAKVKKVTEVKVLTPELVYEFISQIEVHKPYRQNRVRYQQIDIYYHGVGIIRLATAEEMEKSFQKHIANKEQNKQKTA